MLQSSWGPRRLPDLGSRWAPAGADAHDGIGMFPCPGAPLLDACLQGTKLTPCTGTLHCDVHRGREQRPCRRDQAAAHM